MIAKNMELWHHKTKLSIFGAYMVACEMHSLGACTKKTKKNQERVIRSIKIWSFLLEGTISISCAGKYLKVFQEQLWEASCTTSAVQQHP